MEQNTDNHASWHCHSADTLAGLLRVDLKTGLNPAEVLSRRQIHGPNTLPEGKSRSFWLVLASQFQSPVIYLLLAAAAIAFALGHHSDAVVVLTAVILNAVIGTFQEGRAERSLSSLRRMAEIHARVTRAGQESIVPAQDLVPGDLLQLSAGDAVPADARLVEAAGVAAAEAALTGESQPVGKSAEKLPVSTPLGDRRNMIFAGTHVTAGRARALVVATGSTTEIGHIAALASRSGHERTPLERRIEQFGRWLAAAAVAVFALVLAIGHLMGLSISDTFMIGISQMVSMVPEGLPVATTVTLAVGVRRMARRGAIVRRLAAVETLGSTTVICTDKTGTLTRNEMTVTRAWLPDGRFLVIDGGGYAPSGSIHEDGGTDATADPGLLALAEAGALCNDAAIIEREQGRWEALGDPTEAALITFAAKAGILPEAIHQRRPRRAELPFDSIAKLMATQHQDGSRSLVLVKGAPEAIQGLLSDRSAAAPMLEAAGLLAKQGLRLLGVASADGLTLDGKNGFSALTGKCRLLGLLAQVDPPRPEVAEAIRATQRAGIRTIMVTGDHRETGLAIARQLGIAGPDHLALDGVDLERMDPIELARIAPRVAVFARVRPEQKLRIVDAYQRAGHVVAMTGDGVNDAPALMQADVGVAMGRSGTEPAKEAALIVITDDNFATIVAAVDEGRVIYNNLKKVVLYLLSTSIAEVGILLLALGSGFPPPLAAVQILWVNLVTDGLVTVNLILEPPEGNELTKRPVSQREPLLSRTMIKRLLILVPAMVVPAFAWFVIRHDQGIPIDQLRTEVFTLVVVMQWFNVLNCRNARQSGITRGLLGNKWLLGALALGNLLHMAVIFWRPLGEVFHTVPLPWHLAIGIGLTASTVLWVEEARKWRVRRLVSRA